MVLRRNAIANFVGAGWTAIISLAFLPVYIGLMGIEAYGLVGIFAILTTVLGLLDLGMTPTISREMARFSSGQISPTSIRELLRTFEVLIVGVGVVTMLGLALSSSWLSTNWVKPERLTVDQIAWAISLMGVVIGLRFLEGLYRAGLLGLEKQVLASAINGSSATIRALGAWASLVWIGPTIEVFFTWQVAVSLGIVAVNGFALYRQLPWTSEPARFSRQALRSVGRFSGGVMAITFTAILLTQLDKILLSRMLPLSDYAIYAFSAAVAMALYNLVSPITIAFYPRIVGLHSTGSHGAAIQTFHTGARLVSVIVGSAALMLAVFAEPILRLWTGDAALSAKASPVLSLLALGTLANCIMQLPYNVMLAHGRTRLPFVANIIAIAVLGPLLFFLAERYGTVGAASVWVILNLGYIAFCAPLMFAQTMQGELGQWYLHDLLIPLSGAAGILLVSSLLFPMDAALVPQVGILALIAAAALGCALAQAGFRADAVRLVASFMKHRGLS